MEENKLLKELTDGFSTQAKLSNQYWLLLILASVTSIANIPNDKGQINLPFSIGTVKVADFYSFMLLTICVLSLAFASAFLQANRTRKLIQKVIDNTEESKKFIQGIHIQDIFDAVVTPTFNRVAPIAQFLQGDNQFFGEDKPKRINRYLGILIYLLLKIVSMVIIFFIPLVALYKNILLFSNNCEGTSWGIPIFFYWFAFLLSCSIFIIMVFSDLKYMYKVIKRIIKAT